MDELPAYTPQPLTDLLPIYHPPDAQDDHLQTYTLLQPSPSTQTLTSASSTPTLQIKTFKTGGFMNRKPHIIIQPPTPHPTHPLAEARFDIHGTGTSITYPSNHPSRTQRLELSSSRLQILSTTIGGHPHWWRPFPGNKDVWELSNEYEEVIARFVHAPSSTSSNCSSPATSPTLSSQGHFPTPEAVGPQQQQPSAPPLNPSSRTNSVFSISSNTNTGGPASKTKAKRSKELAVIGQLHVVTALTSSDVEREEILCSAIVVVERMRRRRGFLEGQAGRYGGRGVGRDGVGYIPQ